MRRRSLIGAFIGIALAASGATLRAEPAAPHDCGGPGKRACPLQHWMRMRLAAPYATGRTADLAAALESLESLNPNPRRWTNWSTFTRDGSAAATAGRLAQAVEACSRCHRVYRRTYLITDRTRAVIRASAH